MKQQSIAIVVILLVALSAIAVVNASDNWDKDIWNRYRHELIKYFSPRYCGEVGQAYQNNQCKNMDVTVFQFVDEPKDALWQSSNYYLNEDVCKFVPAWSTSFSPKCAGVDCTFEQTYKKALISYKANASIAAKTFLAFNRSPRDKFDKAASSLPWREANPNQLQNFIKSISAAPAATTQFSINVDRNVPVTFHHNPWGLKVPIYAQQTPFMRSISINEAKNKIKSDDEGLSEFLFRRRRAPPPPVVARPVQIIKSNTFKVTFSAKGLTSITVKPGDWFDKDFIEQNKHQLQGVLGPKGSMPLMPETFYVAYQPRVEMVISESQLGMVKKDLDNKNVYAFLIGGSHFSKYNAIPMSDSEVEEFASNKDKYAGDEITWTPLSDEEEAELADSIAESVRQEPKVEEYKDKRSDLLRGNHQSSDDEDEETVTESDAASRSAETVASDWFWRRRRHSPPPPRPPPPPPPKVERNYRIVFQSNSPTPQILAVVSRIIAANAFDCEGYLSRYQDLRLAFHDDCAKARDHFFANGANEGRSCAPAEDPKRAQRMKFDCYTVLGRYENYKRAFGSDCAAAKKHYFEKDFDNLSIDASYEAGAHKAFAALLTGFNCRYYLAANADVARATGNNCDKAKAHYQNNGIKEGRKGSAQFDCYSYLIRYADLLKAFGDNCQRAEQHWYGNGIREKRSADFDATLHNKLAQFNCQSYMNRYADVKKAVRSNCQGAKNHYIAHGIREGRIGN